jgi:hypothetical protein
MPKKAKKRGRHARKEHTTSSVPSGAPHQAAAPSTSSSSSHHRTQSEHRQASSHSSKRHARSSSKHSRSSKRSARSTSRSSRRKGRSPSRTPSEQDLPSSSHSSSEGESSSSSEGKPPRKRRSRSTSTLSGSPTGDTAGYIKPWHTHPTEPSAIIEKKRECCNELQDKAVGQSQRVQDVIKREIEDNFEDWLANHLAKYPRTPPPGMSSFCGPTAARVLKGESPDRAHTNTLRPARHLGSARTHVSALTQSADPPRGIPLDMPDSLPLPGEAGNPREDVLIRDITLPPRNGVNLDTNTILKRGTRHASHPSEALLERPPLDARNDPNHRWSHSLDRNSHTFMRWPNVTALRRKHLRARKPPPGRAPRSLT